MKFAAGALHLAAAAAAVLPKKVSFKTADGEEVMIGPHLFTSDAVDAVCAFTLLEGFDAKSHLAQLFPSHQQLQQDLLQDLLAASSKQSAAGLALHLLEGASEQQLRQLPAGVLVELLCMLTAPMGRIVCTSSCGFQQILRLLDKAVQTLDPGAPSIVSIATGILQSAAELQPLAKSARFQQLLTWLQLYSSPGCMRSIGECAVVAVLVQTMLAHSAPILEDQLKSWALYEQLLAVQQAAGDKRGDAGLSDSRQAALTDLCTPAADSLIQQLREPAWYGTTAQQVLRLLQHTAVQPSDLLQQLSPASQKAVLAAHVRLGQHLEAVLQAMECKQLPELLQLWELQ